MLRPQVLEWWNQLRQRFHPKQIEALIEFKAGKTLVLDWGRRSGKTILVAEILIEDVEEFGHDVMYLALTQKQAREIMWPVFEKRLSNNPEWKSNEQKLTWKNLKSRAQIFLKGADEGADRLRGTGKRVIACDEYAFYKDPGIIRTVLAPMLADYGGQFIYTSSPKGKNHFYKLKNKAKSEPQRYFTSHCTMFHNPFIPPSGRQIVIDEYAGPNDPLYRQEVMAEYLNFEGLVFAFPLESYTTDLWHPAEFTHGTHWFGMDHGFSPDPTAVVWMAHNKKRPYILTYNEYKRSELLVADHVKTIKAMTEYPTREQYSDIDPQLIAEYNNIGLQLSPAQKSDKHAATLKLVSALMSGKLKISKTCTGLLDEMSTYEWGQDGNDHLIDAFRYCFTNLSIPDDTPVETPRERFKKLDPYGQSFGEDY